MMWALPESVSPGIVCEPVPVRESVLVGRWVRLKPGTALQTTKGRSVVVMNQGIRNRNEGPDILGARLYIDGQFYEGDIECHLNAGDWFHHGHAIDPRYQNVILHLVTRESQHQPSIPTVILDAVTVDKMCPVHTRDSRWERVLEQKGNERWMVFVSSFLERFDPQFLWERCLVILGQGGNENAFQHLGTRYTWEQILNFEFSENTVQFLDTLDLHWHHRSIRPVAWPENRYQWLFPIAKTIALVLDKTNLFLPDKSHALFDLRTNRNLKLELMVNVWLPWLGAKAIQKADWTLYDHLKSTWDSQRVSHPYGQVLQRWGTDKRLCKVPVLQGGLSLIRSHCRKGRCTECPIKLFPHDTFN